MATQVTATLAFVAGLLSVLSPCVLALLPVYITYLSGVTVNPSGAGSDGGSRQRVDPRVVGNALVFVVGFSLIFVLFGASASLLGRWLLQNQVLIRKIAGLLVIAMGLHTAGLLPLPFLEREARLDVRAGSGGPIRSFMIGMAFAAGWSPCVGPVLASILALSASTGSVAQGVLLLASYSLGMAVPFVLMAVLLGRLGPVLGLLRRRAKFISVLSGVLMVAIGLMVYADLFTRLAGMFNYYQWF